MIGQLTFGESIDFLQAIETRHNLLEHRLDGWSAWCILRFPIQQALVVPETLPAAKISYRERLALSVADATRPFRPRGSRHVIKTYSSGLVERDGERYKDIWFDDLIEEIGSVFKIEQVNSTMFLSRRTQALIPSDTTTSGIELVASSLARVWRPSRLTGMAQELCRVLEREAGAGIFSEHWISFRLRLFLAQKALYRRLFARIRPRYLLVVNPGEHAAVAAGKELGMVAVELQHGGTTDRYHSGYSWTEYAIPHRGGMPIPDRLFLYGEHTQREIDRHGFWGKSIRVVGCPRVDQYRNRRIGPEPGGPRVLLTTGASIPQVIAFTAEFLRASSDIPGLELRVRLHPIYEGSPQAYLEAFRGEERVQVLPGSVDPSTFELLTQASMHASVSSSCHYDALGLRVPTVILALPTHEIVLPLYQAGHALLARSPAELAAIVRDWRRVRVPSGVSEYYFRPDSVRNMRDDLEADGQV